MSWFRIRTIAFYGFMATVVAIIMATGLLDAIVFTLFRPRVSSREQVDNILLVVKLVGVVIIVAPLFLVMQLFLRGEIAFGASGDASLSRWETNRKHDDLKLEVESLKRTMEEYRKKSESPERVMPTTDDEARAAILKLAPELTLEMLKKEVTTKIVNLSISEYAERTWREMEGNLRAAVASSRRHQVTNLMIGGFGSLIAVLFLFVLIYDAGDRIARTQDWIGLLRHYAPWFSMIVIIEVVVFFFLNLYRQNIEAERYFSNELTNVMTKRIALESAFACGEKTVIRDVVKKLSEEERNRLLKKGDSTIDVERYRAESEGFERGVATVGKFIPWSGEKAEVANRKASRRDGKVTRGLT